MQFFSAFQICLFAVAFGVALMLREGTQETKARAPQRLFQLAA